MKENHMQRLDCKSAGGIQQEDQKRVSASLELAIRVVDLSWNMLSEAAGHFDLEKPEPEDDTPREYIETMKWDALELADGIYWSASEAARRKDDRDLERFETTGVLADEASPRIQALALLTFAKELVESPFASD